MREEFSPVQIQTVHDQVRQFMCRDYLDIRIEIVDHILNMIAEDQERNSQHQFYSSLNDAIDSIGAKKGIREIEFNRKYELWKQYFNGHFTAFIDAFRLPQALLSIVALYLIYTLTHQLDRSYYWIVLFMFSITGVVETFDRWGSRGWVNDQGDTLTSFRIYSRSAFVTNSPLFFVLIAWVRFPNFWFSDYMVAISVYMFLVFFVFRFYFLRHGVRADMMKYRELSVS